jgi:hypothetical protein
MTTQSSTTRELGYTEPPHLTLWEKLALLQKLPLVLGAIIYYGTTGLFQERGRSSYHQHVGYGVMRTVGMRLTWKEAQYVLFILISIINLNWE